MANEILYSGLGDLRVSAILHQELQLKLADRFSMWGHPAIRYYGDQFGTGSTVRTVPIAALDGSDKMAAVTEGSSTSNTALTDASVNITIARQALQYQISDLANITDSVGLTSMRLADSMVGSAAMRFQELIAALMGSFSNTVGTSGVDLSATNFFSAIFTLTQNNVPLPYLSILHPVQTTDLQSSIRSEAGAIQFIASTQDMLLAKGPGFAGSFAGVDIYTSSQVATANAGADRAGGVFGLGAVGYCDGSPAAIQGAGGLVLPAGTKVVVEFERDAAAALTKVVGSYYVGVAEIEDLRGVSVITDA